MSRQDANAAFALTSFLYGSNAPYIEDLYARYEADPRAVDAEWQAFFQNLKDSTADVEKNARGPSWGRPDWPPLPGGDLVAALDGNWAEVGNGVGSPSSRYPYRASDAASYRPCATRSSTNTCACRRRISTRKPQVP